MSEGYVTTLAATKVRSSALYVPKGANGFTLLCPTLDAGGHTLKLEVYGGDKPPSPADTANAVLAITYTTDWLACSTVLTTGGDEVSVVGELWRLGGHWVRVFASNAQAADLKVTFILGR